VFLLLVFHKFLDIDWTFTLKINADFRVGLSVPRKLRLCCNYFVNMLFSYSLTLNVMLFWCHFMCKSKTFGRGAFLLILLSSNVVITLSTIIVVLRHSDFIC
jgi:hypothetical protein